MTNQLSVNEANSSIGTRKEAYNLASSLYYLPNFSCTSCMSLLYLTKIITEPCPFFKIEKTKINPNHICYRKFDCATLLEHLEDVLFANNLKPTGFTALYPPNLEWLTNVLLALEPSDPLELLSKGPKKIEDEATIMIDPRLIGNLAQMGPRKSRKGFFKPSVEERAAIELNKINASIKRKEKASLRAQKIAEEQKSEEKLLINKRSNFIKDLKSDPDTKNLVSIDDKNKVLKFHEQGKISPGLYQKLGAFTLDSAQKKFSTFETEEEEKTIETKKEIHCIRISEEDEDM